MKAFEQVIEGCMARVVEERFGDCSVLSKAWAGLSVLERLGGQGAARLCLRKVRGFGEPLELHLAEGWGPLAADLEPLEQRAQRLFAA